MSLSPSYHVRSLRITECGAEITLVHNSKQFIASLAGADLEIGGNEQKLKEEYLAITTGAEKERDMARWIVEALEDEIARLAPFSSCGKTSFSVQSYYRPEAISELAESQRNFHPIDASKVEIIPSRVPSSDKVKLDGNEYSFKHARDSHCFDHELSILQKLVSLGLSKRLRVPPLCGVVSYSDEQDVICGILLEPIGSKGWLGTTESGGFSNEQRVKWMAQIEEVVKQLHAHDIIWGDVRPENVLIDKADDAWVTGFGPSESPRFVDRGMIGTVEGDMQGLAKMRDYLGYLP
ncbi:serine/threonine protein kinase [Trichophyton tonsurans CBS 112818]|uniref:Serine/threonine protein kinase n=1 Tax=Trichophyton tonsurans (strain CBS 112818) TaxID=647933 RepID=F2RUQ2_TRIT1|nr:serine/threonine protein kinase [Trichophyton tonsurans CBS 112818]